MTLPFEDARFDALKKLAAARFGKVKPAEEKVLSRSASAEDQPPDKVTDRPVVRADFLRWLATDKGASESIDPLGLRVHNATIPSGLDLDFCKMSFPLRFLNCALQGNLSLRSSQLRALELAGCTAEKDVVADGLRTQRGISFRNLRAKGTIRLLGARIDGGIDCGGAALESTGDSFNADEARITGSVLLRDGFSSKGTISLALAQIGSILTCPGATLSATGDALNAYGAKIAGGVFLRDGFSSSGTIRFPLAQIGGDLDCSGADRFGTIMCDKMRVEGRMIYTDIAHPENSELRLSGATVGELHDDRKSWPSKGNLHLDGFVYKDLILRERAAPKQVQTYQLGTSLGLDSDTRIEWLNRQPDQELVNAQPWMQLVGLLEARGNSRGAKHVRYEYDRQRAKAGNWYLRPFSWVYDQIEEQPLRISVPILGLWAVGSLVFWRAARIRAMTPTDREKHWRAKEADAAHRHQPPFNPAIYALENVLPVVRLGQDNAWAPDPDAPPGTWLPQSERIRKFFNNWAFTRWLACLDYRRLAFTRWALILLGWVLALILAAAISGSFKP